jgi:tocopherol O-methyltransferase
MSSELDSINCYYEECYLYYKIFWRSHKNLCLHYGYHDNGRGHGRAVVRMIEVLAENAGITSKDRVLDIGCGVGGSALWLGRNIGCEVVGIDINHDFINVAQSEAKKRNLSRQVSFREMDFCRTSFNEKAFDVIWAIESSCHAADKMAFLREMGRILRPGGRIVIADGYKTAESSEFGDYLSGWAVPGIPTIAEFTDYLVKAGFQNVVCDDISDKVMPSSLRIYCLAWIAYPLVALLRLFRLKTRISTNHARLALKQYGYATGGSGKYCIFVAEKAPLGEGVNRGVAGGNNTG